MASCFNYITTQLLPLHGQFVHVSQHGHLVASQHCPVLHRPRHTLVSVPAGQQPQHSWPHGDAHAHGVGHVGTAMQHVQQQVARMRHERSLLSRSSLNQRTKRRGQLGVCLSWCVGFFFFFGLVFFV